MEELIGAFVRITSESIEVIAVLIVVYGAIEAFIKILWIVVTPGATHGERKKVWRQLGTWLLLGLEFELAADIISSVFSPTQEELIKLAAIAVIRTFLNFFLERDLEHAEQAGVEGRPAARVEGAGRGSG